jgi:hypothetical protein
VHGRLITRIFVICDVISCLVQASGSSIASSTEWVGSTADIGIWVLIGGLVLQAVAFVFFMAIFARFHYIAKKKGLVAADAPAGWERLVVAVYVSSSFILVCISLSLCVACSGRGKENARMLTQTLLQVRCIYRIAEFAEGAEGYAFLHEWMFWIFESLPMLIAIGVFCVWHPSAYLGRDGAKARIRGKAGEAVDSEEGATELRSSYRSSRQGR